MRNRIRVMLLTGGVILAAGLTAAPSLATAMTWTIKPGGPITGKSGKVMLDEGSSTLLTCASTFTGTLKSGSGLPGKNAGSITSIGFSNCTSSVGPPFTLTATVPWSINFSSLSGGVVHGTLGSVELKLAGAACSATVDGTSASGANGVVAFTWTPGTGKLKLLKTGGNLHYYNVSGCLGLITNGDPASLSGTYTVTPTQSIS